jgi:hypothetical protein
VAWSYVSLELPNFFRNTGSRECFVAFDRVHRVLCDLPGRGDLGLYKRGLPEPSPFERSEHRQFGPLGNECADSRIVLAASSNAYPFFFFAGMMALQFLIVLFVYPETKGVSLEKIHATLGIE